MTLVLFIFLPLKRKRPVRCVEIFCCSYLPVVITFVVFKSKLIKIQAGYLFHLLSLGVQNRFFQDFGK